MLQEDAFLLHTYKKSDPVIAAIYLCYSELGRIGPVLVKKTPNLQLFIPEITVLSFTEQIVSGPLHTELIKKATYFIKLLTEKKFNFKENSWYITDPGTGSLKEISCADDYWEIICN